MQENNPKHRWRWLKRTGFALLMPIALFLAGVLLLSIFGGGTADKIDGALKSMWLPASIMRLLSYLLLAYVIVPHFIRKKLAQADYYRQHIELALEQSESEFETQELEVYHHHVCARITAYNNYLNNRHWILIALLIFDALTIQLPFLLRG